MFGASKRVLAATRTGIVRVNISLRRCSLRRNGRMRHPISFVAALIPQRRGVVNERAPAPCNAIGRAGIMPKSFSHLVGRLCASTGSMSACFDPKISAIRACFQSLLTGCIQPSFSSGCRLTIGPFPTTHRNGDRKLSCRQGGEASLAILVESRRGCGHDGRQRRTPQRELGDASTG